MADLVALQNALNRSISTAAAAGVDEVGATGAVETGGVSAASGRVATVKCERYKTELCRTYDENGSCRYGDKCQFAHGAGELRRVARHPKYKTDLCRTFHTTGFCPYGSRCHFIHSLHESRQVPAAHAAGLLLPPPPSVQTGSHVQVGTDAQSLDDLLRVLSSLLQTNHHPPADHVRQQQPAEFLSRHAAAAHRLSYVSDASAASMLSTDSASPCPSPTSLGVVAEDLWSTSRPYLAVSAARRSAGGFQSPIPVPVSVLSPPGSPGSAASSLNSFSSDFDAYDAASSRSVWPALASPVNSIDVSRIHFPLLTSKQSLFA